jgi:hypothetical protein
MPKDTGQIVKLPDGVFVTEWREEHVGDSETQITYEYFHMNGSLLDKSKYELDYWGNIKGAKLSSIKEFDNSQAPQDPENRFRLLSEHPIG